MVSKSFVSFSAADIGLRSAVRDLRGQYQSGNQAMLEANRASLSYLKEASAEILRTSIKREKDRRNKRGLGVVSDDAAHEANTDRFSFWVLDRIDAIDRRVRSYYRAIDQGSDYWVESGRYVALFWYPGSPSTPSGAVNTQAAVPDPFGARVRITKPVPAYEFLSLPVRNFKDQGLYANFVRHAFERRGLKPVITATS